MQRIMGLNINETLLKLPISSLNAEANIKYFLKQSGLWIYKEDITYLLT